MVRWQNRKQLEDQTQLSDRKASSCKSPVTWETRLLWLLVLVLLGYWSYGQIRDRVDPGLHRHVLQLLRAQYPNHIVTLQSAHVVEGKAIVLDGLRFALPSSTGPRDIIRIERLTALGDICLLNLLNKDLKISEVNIDD